MNSDRLSNITLKDLRAKNNKTQRQLGDALGLRAQTISDWERGFTNPRMSLRQASILCHELNCTIHELADAVDLAGEPDSYDEEQEKQQKQLVAAGK
jgi:transcriptional regulator with XRE-family HTH domain